ncbi:hypothetical protein BT67DRAFT_11580 [Trichocladium antarcticum]|uniref:CFEM domain-containing protein n=1 Tax=Trichocladium antarcticum TaxID=1450529 RepID=A0AAN6ZIB4_9PEZI|nr:hypothetical protein BT67DRAFT_11580 [Trichocladium antarcticum]
MKFSAAILPALVAVASAQSLDMLPKCSVPCIQKAVADTTKCEATDFACVCENMAALTGAATGCVIENCGIDVAINEVVPGTKTFCEAVAAGGGGGGDSSSSSSDPPFEESMTPPPTTKTEAPATTETEAPATTEETPEPTQTDDGEEEEDDEEETASTAPSSIPTTPPASNATTTAGNPPTETVHPGAAAGVTYIGSLAMLALGALAAF